MMAARRALLRSSSFILAISCRFSCGHGCRMMPVSRDRALSSSDDNISIASSGTVRMPIAASVEVVVLKTTDLMTGVLQTKVLLEMIWRPSAEQEQMQMHIATSNRGVVGQANKLTQGSPYQPSALPTPPQ